MTLAMLVIALALDATPLAEQPAVGCKDTASS